MRKQLIRQLVCSAVVSIASVSAASADTLDLGLVAAGTTESFNRAVIGGPAPVTFEDFITFELPLNGGSAYSVIDFPVPALNLGLTFASMALFSMGADGAIGGTGANADTLIAQAGGVPNTTSTSLAFTVPQQIPGKMYLFVSGFTTASAGGLYNGSVAVFPAPVPEPETWAMMLVGAGLVGFRLRNRSRKAAANRLV